MAKRALILGISGQDGAYLAQFLLGRDYQVFGTSRDASASSFHNLKRLGIFSRVTVGSAVLSDFRSVINALTEFAPDEVYNLSGQSSVGLSFQQPLETFESIAIGTLNLLEAARIVGKKVRIYNAGSSECFGDVGSEPADETTPFRPCSPYGVAKAAAIWHVANYRKAYGLFASSGILFNHESPLRPERFVTRKISQAACRIARGSSEKLHLGNVSIQRDWGWAPEYVEAMWRMLQQDSPGDFVIATGHTASLEQFVRSAFETVGLDWREHVFFDPALMRPSEILVGRANPRRAAEQLEWVATRHMPEVVRSMVKAELENTQAV